MINNYLKIALRNLARHKQMTLINVLGLAVGMAACILILLFVQYELSYDRHHENADRTYRISREWRNADGETNLHLGHLAPPFEPRLAEDFAGIIEKSTRLANNGMLITYEEGDKQMIEDGLFFAEPEALDIFSFSFVAGAPETALSLPNAVVLTESTARKYFGDEDPLGKALRLEQEIDLKVTGVIEDVPGNSHFHPTMLVSFVLVEGFYGQDYMNTNWASNNFSTYVLLAEGYNPTDLEAQFPAFLDKHLPGDPDVPASQTNFLHLWPITDIHLYSNLDSEIEANGDIAYVYIYTVIALFILVIACINFINLTTARATRRAKEVGVRKVMGAEKASLVGQFLSESVLVSLFGLTLAILLVTLALPYFTDFVDKQLSFDILGNPFLLALLAAIVLVVGIVSGSYPAFYLSAFQPARILRSSRGSQRGNVLLRSGLVVLQFVISIALVIGVITVERQLDYVKSKPLGFNQENLLVLPISRSIYDQYEELKAQFLAQPGIVDVALASRVPSGRLLDSQGGQVEVNDGMKDIDFRLANIDVGHDYINSLDINLVAGRNFDINRVSDSTEAFIINEVAAHTIGYNSPEEAVGKKISYGGRQGYIIGVAEDFHFESLHQPIAPIIFHIPFSADRVRRVVVRVQASAMDETISYLKEQWSYLRPGFPFDYYTIGDRFQGQYDAEDRLGQIVQFFSLLAIFIAALGLVGLASYTAEQRTKEIGIRKVLGASVSQLLLLLTKGFSKLILVAFLIACPLAYFVMNHWLDTFAYQDTLSIWSFILAGVAALLVAGITVGSQTISTATRNPVDSLRDE
ncbi:ABC transporter permease [Tunicatimonas pelagia]|uniref:ABC transporter permease n=1 Tax=Tunicatimonas pelagia TaxID=931531 RepID=UPI0026669B9E|nr:ABC transporter permease [Tunicatimonas pelagia]WKN41006.1 ABC transporter permease [Tunicatimonas pelagia]